MKITKCNIYGGMKMKEFKYVITDNEGIHARPAGELVKLAKSCLLYTSPSPRD